MIAFEPTQENLITAAISLVGVLVLSVAVLRNSRKNLDRDCKDFDGSTAGLSILANSDSVLKRDQVKKSVTEYFDLFTGSRSNVGAISDEKSVSKRSKEYQTMVVNFYDLVTDFYEYGWGQSFHFAPRWKNETFMESIKRAEHFLCNMLNMKPGVRALDVGCGVGGPMRNMAIFSGATIDGVTINEYQVRISNKYNERMGLSHLCTTHQGDFQKLGETFEPGTFDVAYAIEATCHSPDKAQTFAEVAKVLKPGGHFAGLEWVMVGGYDENNKDHVRVKEGIEEGNGLPTLWYPSYVVESLEKAGFEVIEHYDLNAGVHSPAQVPWYATLNGSYNLSGFRMTLIGRYCTHAMVSVLEFLRIAPKGSTRVSRMLNATALDLCEGGKNEIFTPSYYFLARKK